jgi:sugar lactone lactonase YvrE
MRLQPLFHLHRRMVSARCLAVALSVAGCFAGATGSPSYQFSTLAGSPGGPGAASGPRLAARFDSPAATAVDPAGNLFVADYGNSVIRKIDTNGWVSTFAGQIGQSGNADGPGAAAAFNGPASLACDAAGNLYVADTGNNAIRKITPAGLVTTFAGASTNAGSADGLGAEAQFRSPTGVAVDPVGNVYIADYGNSVIRRATPDGLVSTVAGVAGTNGAADGPAASALFFHPVALAVDRQTNVYVADADNSTIRVLRPDGTVTTLAGTAGVNGDTNAVGAQAEFNYPQGVAVDAQGIVYVGDTGNHTIRRIAADGTVTQLAGSSRESGSADGIGAAALLSSPSGLAVSGSGLYVADRGNHAIRFVSFAGQVTTWAGASGGDAGLADGSGTAARFATPRGLALGADGNLFVADDGNLAVRIISPNGQVATAASASAWLTNLWAVAVDSATNVYAAGAELKSFALSGPNSYSAMGSLILRLDPSDNFLPYAGGWQPSQPGYNNYSLDGVGTNAAFAGIADLVIGPQNSLFVADLGLSTLRTVFADGTVATLAGQSTNKVSYPYFYGSPGFVNGSNSMARFNQPAGLAVAPDGIVFVADRENNTIRKVTPDGWVTNLIGYRDPVTQALTAPAGYVDGPASVAQFFQPTAIALDASGNLYIADQLGIVIRRLSPDGLVTTLAGVAGLRGASDGVGAAAQFRSIEALVIDADNNLYVSDSGNNRIVKGVPVPPLALAAVRAGEQLQLTLTTPGPGTFAIEYSPTLTAAAPWLAVSGLENVTVSGGFGSWIDASATDEARYYRVVQLP